MKLTMRSYNGNEDYWRMREFLRQVMLLNDRREICWHVARLDYWWWFINPFLEKMALEERLFFWESEAGQIAAVLNPEGIYQAFLQVHPAFRAPELVEEMVAVAISQPQILDAEGRPKVWFYIDAQDALCQEILTRHGFQRSQEPEAWEYQYRCVLDGKLFAAPVIPGYQLRPLRDGLELLERCYASGLGFHNDDIHTARDNRDRPEWYHHLQSAPLYRRDLDLVAVATDGSIAAFCTIWFDDVTRTAYFEPVATVPAHQRRGLGRALMLTGLRRLGQMGCQVAFVGGYSQMARALYCSVMGPDYDISEPWGMVT